MRAIFRVVFDALVENNVGWLATPVFGEGAKDNTRGRVCSPWMLRRLPIRHLKSEGPLSALTDLKRGSTLATLPGTSQLQEILQQSLAVLREDRLRVELDAMHWKFLVLQSHDLALFGPSGNL